MMSLSVSRKSIFVATLLCFLPWLFGQISGDSGRSDYFRIACPGFW